MTQYIVGYRNECVLLAEHLTILADKCKTVDIGVNYDTKIESTLLHLIHDTLQILLQRLWVVSEVACALAVEYLVVYAKCLEQVGQDNATNRIDGVNANAELARLDGIDIYKLESKHRVDVALIERIVDST